MPLEDGNYNIYAFGTYCCIFTLPQWLCSPKGSEPYRLVTKKQKKKVWLAFQRFPPVEISSAATCLTGQSGNFALVDPLFRSDLAF